MDHEGEAIRLRLERFAGALDEARNAVSTALDVNEDDSASLAERLSSLHRFALGFAAPPGASALRCGIWLDAGQTALTGWPNLR
jgi:hypothetical protein